MQLLEKMLVQNRTSLHWHGMLFNSRPIFMCVKASGSRAPSIALSVRKVKMRKRNGH